MGRASAPAAAGKTIAEGRAGGPVLKISEVARRAGVSRSTVQHYLREGLLPKPAKTHRNMAWYDQACVERIRLVRDMQKRRFLPLSVIKSVLAGRGETAVRAALEAQAAALASLSPEAQATSLDAEAAARTFALTKSLLDRLVRLGLVTQAREKGRAVFRGPDLEVLAAVGDLGKLGFTVAAGFRAEDLLIYKQAIEGLLREEVKIFLRTVVARAPEGDVSRLAHAAVDGGTALLVALRKKLIANLLENAGGTGF